MPITCGDLEAEGDAQSVTSSDAHGAGAFPGGRSKLRTQRTNAVVNTT